MPRDRRAFGDGRPYSIVSEGDQLPLDRAAARTRDDLRPWELSLASRSSEAVPRAPFRRESFEVGRGRAGRGRGGARPGAGGAGRSLCLGRAPTRGDGRARRREDRGAELRSVLWSLNRSSEASSGPGGRVRGSASAGGRIELVVAPCCEHRVRARGPRTAHSRVAPGLASRFALGSPVRPCASRERGPFYRRANSLSIGALANPRSAERRGRYYPGEPASRGVGPEVPCSAGRHRGRSAGCRHARGGARSESEGERSVRHAPRSTADWRRLRWAPEIARLERGWTTGPCSWIMWRTQIS